MRDADENACDLQTTECEWLYSTFFVMENADTHLYDIRKQINSKIVWCAW